MEKSFHLHDALTTLYGKTKAIRSKHHTELIYNISNTIPKELKGDSAPFLTILETIVVFIVRNSDTREILLSLDAPKDFLYEEIISFTLEKISIPKEKIGYFLSQGLQNQIDTLHGEILYDIGDSIQINLPFQVVEIGHRRNFRLPHEHMLDKKVLLICTNEHKAQSIEKMFQYFHYKVDKGIEGYQGSNSDLGQYDMFVLDDDFVTKKLEESITQIELDNGMKFVRIKECDEDQSQFKISTNLCMPVTQESIFQLILKLFEEPTQRPFPQKHYPVDLTQLLMTYQPNEKICAATIGTTMPEILKIKIGDINYEASEVLSKNDTHTNPTIDDIHYLDMLQEFIDTFGYSDLYLKEIVEKQQKEKIEEFCFYLGEKSKQIGALRTEKLTQIIALILEYELWDILSMYAHKYHIELKNLLPKLKTIVSMRAHD